MELIKDQNLIGANNDFLAWEGNNGYAYITEIDGEEIIVRFDYNYERYPEDEDGGYDEAIGQACSQALEFIRTHAVNQFGKLVRTHTREEMDEFNKIRENKEAIEYEQGENYTRV